MIRALMSALILTLAATLVSGCDSDPPTRLRSCRLAESSLDFGSVYVGESATRDFLVINDGTAELNLTAVVASPDFHLAEGDTVRFVANPGDTVRVPVVFAPTSLGPKSAALALTGGPCDGASLKGEGANPCLVEPETLEFGIVSLDTPETETLTITNLGNNGLEGSVSLDCPEFTIPTGAGPFSLEHGESREVVVELTATQLGSKRCMVDLGMPLCSQAECLAKAGRTWEVTVDGSGDAPTVQAAIDSASSGEVVLVHPGRYIEAINYRGKELAVRSVSGPEVTILDAAGASVSVVTFNSGEGPRTLLEGFTVTGGSTADEFPVGGGVLISDAEPVIQGNIIRNNYAKYYGGGIYAFGVGWTPVIRDNTVRLNQARTNGGGVGISTGRLEHNWIRDNSCLVGDGGGIWIHTANDIFPAHVGVYRNTVVNNVAHDHGGGIYVGTAGASEVAIADNLIVGNRAGGQEFVQFSGGGIWLFGGSFWVHHNTIVGNHADGVDVTWGGGGIASIGPGAKVIEQNIIAYSTHGGGIRCDSAVGLTIRSNLAWENTGGDGNGPCAEWTSTEGNLSADPLFCDRENGDYHLAENSPALLHPAGPLGAFSIPGCSPTAVVLGIPGQSPPPYRWSTEVPPAGADRRESGILNEH